MDLISDVSGLIVQLRALRSNNSLDEVTRKSLLEALRDLLPALETPGDTIHRICYAPLQLTAARIASDINLFEALAEKNGSLTIQELVKHTKTNEAFLGRLLRYLASMGTVQEAGEDKFSASNITRTLTIPGLKAGIYFNHDTILPCYQALPEYLAENDYQNPYDSANGPMQKGHRTNQPPMVWLAERPAQLEYFNLWVGATHESQNTFLDVFPFENELCHDLQPGTPLFVDIGGGIGQQCQLLKARLPHVPGRVIVQDLPPVIAQAPVIEGIEMMAHNFMEGQPIKGARVYYLRNIIHNHADEKAVMILQQIIKAMGQDSVILIDDMVIPVQGAHWQATQLDLTMMAGLAAIERTEKQWRGLLDTAGLTIKQICTYTPERRDSIIVAVPK